MSHSRSFISSEGVMLVLSSPSGAGKTTISNILVEREKKLVRSISVTTRKRRPNEIEGRDYFFLEKEEEFLNLCNSNQMLEYARVFGNYYGIPRAFVQEKLEEGISVLFAIDWQGAYQLMQNMAEHVVSVFIMPPSIAELEKRLHLRGDESVEIINRRLDEAAFEMSHCYEYDYIIVNESIEESVKQVQSILLAEKLRTKRCKELSKFIEQMNVERSANVVHK